MSRVLPPSLTHMANSSTTSAVYSPATSSVLRECVEPALRHNVDPATLMEAFAKHFGKAGEASGEGGEGPGRDDDPASPVELGGADDPRSLQTSHRAVDESDVSNSKPISPARSQTASQADVEVPTASL